MVSWLCTCTLTMSVSVLTCFVYCFYHMHVSDVHGRPITLLLVDSSPSRCFWLCVTVYCHSLQIRKHQSMKLHFGRENSVHSYMMATQFGCLIGFQPESNSVKAYFERVHISTSLPMTWAQRSKSLSTSAPLVQPCMHFWVSWWLRMNWAPNVSKKSLMCYMLTLSQNSLCWLNASTSTSMPDTQ